MALTILILIGAAVLIYLSCELFVNSIEWVGKSFNISQNAVGTILAAFGTALPESVVTFIAVVFGKSADQKDIGVGAALGGPLVLSTVAYAVVGLVAFAFCSRRICGKEIEINGRKLGRDQLWFLSIFIFKVGLGFVIFPGKMWTGLLFLAAYGFYFYKEMRSKDDEDEVNIEPLRFRSKTDKPEKTWVLIQTIFSLILIFIGSQVFVQNLETFSISLGIKPLIISLLLSPIATELPETLNAIIWVRQGKEKLALANISGAMMIQATVPSALGILFTPWIFDTYLAIAAIVTIMSISFLWITLYKNKLSAKRLTFAALFYIIFALSILLIKTPQSIVFFTIK